MALSGEDKQDVKRSMGKALANKISKVTRDGEKKSTRTHFMGTGTHVETEKGKTHGVYHGTKVATKNKHGDLHFRTGGWLTPTTTRRMSTFAKEHGGRNIAISRAKGKLTAYEDGKAIAHSGEKKGEHLMTIRNRKK